jgi:hypothetical protein
MLFSKPIAKLWTHWHVQRMSELGLELREALLKDSWEMSEHRLTHVASGVTLWIGGGIDRFRVYDIPKEIHVGSYYEKALNLHDRVVLWDLFIELKRRAEVKPADLVLNHLRLGRIKEQGEIK